MNRAALFTAIFAASALHASAANALRCAPVAAPIETSIPLNPGEQLGRVALNQSPDRTLWFAARVAPPRFARRPRTRVVAGAFDLQNQRWIVAPTEVASLPGSADLPLAIAASNDGAIVLVSRPRAVLARAITRSTAALSAPTEWSAPRTITGPALLDARNEWYSILWRSPARLSFARGSAGALSLAAPTVAHVPRRGSLAGDGLVATIARNESSSWALFSLRSGALSLVRVDDRTIAERVAQPAHCPDRCERTDVQTTDDGAVVTYAMKTQGDRTLRAFWASRIAAASRGHSQSTIPLLRASAVPFGAQHAALAQWSRPIVLRAIERPIALTLPTSSIPRQIRSRIDGDATLVLSAHDRGALSISRVRCE